MCTRENLVKCNKLKVTNISDEILDKFYLLVKSFYQKSYQITVAPMGLGEPFLYPDLYKFVSKIKKIGQDIKVVIVTNGILFDNEIGKKIIESGIDEISVSLNAKNRNDYKKYMRVDSYFLVKKNISEFIKLRNKLKSNLPHLYVQYLDFKNNANKFNKEINRWNRLMLASDKCYVHPIVNQAGFKKGIKNNYKSNSYPCISPLSRLVIKINGDTYPCDACLYNGLMKEKQLFLGNILKDNLMYEFENKNGKSKQIFNKMRQKDYSNLSVCKRCNTYKLSPNCYFSLPFGLKIGKYKWY
jgi:radical SAM protein with 4Fe4S-binding SPASM domain